MSKRARRKQASQGRSVLRHPASRAAPSISATTQDADLPELREARRLWQTNHFDAALASFRRAVERHPRNRIALLDAARAFGARYELDQAEQWIDRLLEISGDDPVQIHLGAQSLRMIHRPQRALPLFERVVASTDAVPDAFLELALMYERTHRLEEAFALIERCLAATPDYLEPRLVQARLHRRLGRDGAAESVLRDLTRHPAADPTLRAQAWADLAEMHDRRGEFDAAMAAIRRCKSIQLGQDALVKRISDQLIQNFRGLVGAVTTDDFNRWRAAVAPETTRRVALLTGFPRSGTTLLEQVLDAHPGVAASEELDVFSRDVFPLLWRRPGGAGPALAAPTVEALSTLPMDIWLGLREQYLATMGRVSREPIGDRLHLDKNPAMTLLIPAFRRLFPEAAILLALRDPRDVILSCFLRYLPLNTNSVWYLTLERAAERYAIDMRAWCELREKLPGPWTQVRYEDVVADLPGQARRCLDTLGVPWDPAVQEYRDRLPDKLVRSPSYEAVAKPVYKTAIGRWQNYARYFEPVLPVLEPFVRAFGYA
jgi:Flp pilus assembly protein TadD